MILQKAFEHRWVDQRMILKREFRHTLHSRIRTRKRWAQAEESDLKYDKGG